MAPQRKKTPSAMKKTRTSNTNGANARGCAECERLKQTVKRLRAARKQDRRLMAELERERDTSRRAVIELMKDEWKEEDWKNLRIEDCIPFEQILEEIEQKLGK
jgi:hypothetical protein